MKVFIVEDSGKVRELLQRMLTNLPNAQFVGSAVDELGAIECIEALLPDVVILDLNLKPGSGVEVLKSIKKNHPEIKVIVLTNYVDEFYIKSCKDAGVDYFFDKTFQFSMVRAVLWSLVYDDHSARKVEALLKNGEENPKYSLEQQNAA